MRAPAPPFHPDRRRFLQTSLAGSAVLLAAAALPAGCGRDEPVPKGLLALAPGEYLTFAAVAARILPEGGAFAPGAATVDVPRRVDRLVAALGGDEWLRIKRALRVFGYAPLLSLRRKSFRGLDPAEQDRILQAWHSSRRAFRLEVFETLKSLTMIAFYNSHAGRDALGLGPPACRPKGAKRRRSPASAIPGAAAP